MCAMALNVQKARVGTHEVPCESSLAAQNCIPETTKAISLAGADPFDSLTVIIPPLTLW